MNPKVEELLELVDRIADLEGRIRAEDENQLPPRQTMQLIRARAILELTSALDQRGKPLYPNEKPREAALIVSLARNAEYQDALKEVQQSKRRGEELIVEQMCLQNRRAVLMLALGDQPPRP